MKRILAGVCCALLCTLPAAAQRHHQLVRNANNHSNNNGQAMNPQQFVDFAAQSQMVCAHLGEEAQNTAKAVGVKSYGQMLATDSKDEYGMLHKAAAQANVNVPGAINQKYDRAMITPLKRLSGKAFDRDFVRTLIMGHKKAIPIYQKEAANGSNPALQQYAKDVLPRLQSQLQQAEQLEKHPGHEAAGMKHPAP